MGPWKRLGARPPTQAQLHSRRRPRGSLLAAGQLLRPEGCSMGSGLWTKGNKPPSLSFRETGEARRTASVAPAGRSPGHSRPNCSRRWDCGVKC